MRSGIAVIRDSKEWRKEQHEGKAISNSKYQIIGKRKYDPKKDEWKNFNVRCFSIQATIEAVVTNNLGYLDRRGLIGLENEGEDYEEVLQIHLQGLDSQHILPDWTGEVENHPSFQETYCHPPTIL